MEIGSLFFKIGFNSEGTEPAAKFQGITEHLAETSANAVKVLERMSDVLEKIAVKMGAVTQAELDAEKASKQHTEQTEKQSSSHKTLLDRLREGKDRLGAFGSKIQGMFGDLNIARLQLIGFATALELLAKRASDVARNLVNFETLTGLSKQSLQALQAQASITGASFDEVADSIKHLQQEATAIKMGEGNAKAFAMLGLSPGQNPFQMIESLKAKAAGLPSDRFAFFARQLGLSEQMMIFLKEASQIEPIKKDFFLGEEEITRLNRFQLMFNRMWTQFKMAMTKIGSFVEPMARPILDFINRFTLAFSHIVNELEKYSSGVKIFFNLILAFGSVLAAVFFPVTAILGAIILLIDDIVSYMQGDDSLIGFMLQKFQKQIEQVKEFLTEVLDWFTQKFGWVKNILPDSSKLMGAMEGIDMGSPDQIANSIAPASNSTQNNNIEINVNGAQSPIATAREIDKKIKDSTGQGFYQQPVPVK